jgi:signal transduction histidine kinase
VRPLRLVLLPAAVAAGLAVEWVFHDPALGPALTAADFAVGAALLACGIVAWQRRPESLVGALMVLGGFTWFLGNFAEPLVYLHRGPLVHLVLSFPTGRLRGRLARAVVWLAYVDGAIEPLAGSDGVTLVVSGLVAVTALELFLGARGPARKAAGPALAAALAYAGALAFGALERLAGWQMPNAVLWTYDVAVAGIAIGLLVSLLRSRWAEAVVTGLVVDLGASGDAGTLRAKVAHALGDPTLEVGYRVAETGAFVDDAGRPLELPAPGYGRTTTRIGDLAVLVHDEALSADQELLDSVAAAARIAVANARLQAESRARAVELEASRRRIVEAADAQRRRLERELRLGAERRLETVASLLAGARPALESDAEALSGIESELVEARQELEEFAYGVMPAALTEGGLAPALAQLVGRAAIPVEVKGHVGRLPAPVEAALFFVCSEALANVAKHAAASHATVDVRSDAENVTAEIADDGVGGADVTAGSGLSGLVDRVEALGGTLRLESPRGGGTRIVAEIPSGSAPPARRRASARRRGRDGA